MSKCMVRSDLLLAGLSVPVGGEVYHGKNKFSYRYKDNDDFEILYGTQWVEAYSIDWEFIDDRQYINYYECPRCKEKWADVDEAQPDDDCPECGLRHITPYKSEEVVHD
jgi:DNA-directed RNA polymerase subunit RPC12/RpoP